MSRASPPVTVCLPVYNGARYLRESIASVLAQSYGDFRLIVSDNWSTDASADIVHSFRDDRITYVRPAEHLQIVRSNSYCLSLATGEYVCAWAHDDTMMPDNLRQKVAFLKEHPRAGFVHSNVLLTDAEGRTLGEHWAPDSRRDYFEPGLAVAQRYLRNVARGSIIFIGAVLARRDCYDKLGTFRADIPGAFDSEMWMRIALFYDVGCLSAPLVTYRKHASMFSVTTAATEDFHGLNPRGFADHFQAARIIFDEYGERIPERVALRREVFAIFAREASGQARRMYEMHRFSESRAFLLQALRISPAIAATPEWWDIALRLSTRFCGTLRRRLAR
jgi:glycosyltransferase involved in cell wall biosynthesis